MQELCAAVTDSARCSTSATSSSSGVRAAGRSRAPRPQRRSRCASTASRPPPSLAAARRAARSPNTAARSAPLAGTCQPRAEPQRPLSHHPPTARANSVGLQTKGRCIDRPLHERRQGAASDASARPGSRIRAPAGRPAPRRCPRVFSDQRTRDRRADRDLVVLDVGLIVADDLVGHDLAAVQVFELDRGAEHAPDRPHRAAVSDR